MRIAIGSDHAGFDQKSQLAEYLRRAGHDVSDVGTFGGESVDYPDYAQAVSRAVGAGEAQAGVLVCGTGIGMSITANKVAGVRAANITDPEFAKLARAHNDANVVSLSGRFVPLETNERIVDAFLATSFEGGRHARRVEKIEAAESSASDG